MQGAFLTFINNTFVTACSSPGAVYVYDTSQDYLRYVYGYTISNSYSLFGMAFFKKTPNYALLAFSGWIIALLEITS
jgi:hypothetical protein